MNSIELCSFEGIRFKLFSFEEISIELCIFEGISIKLLRLRRLVLSCIAMRR